MEKMVNSINWFEIPVLNFDRAKEFYSRLYNYEMIETPRNGLRIGLLPIEDQSKGVGGAIVQANEYFPSALGTRIYLNGGEDLQNVLDRVIPAGGEIIQHKTKINDEIGFFAIFEDTEGNHISLHSKK